MRRITLWMIPSLVLLMPSCDSCPDPEPCDECPECPVDEDGDGYTEEQGDCDDTDAENHPRRDEICGDEIDWDCSGDPDDGATDADGDGYVDAACTGGDDCDDADAGINPTAEDGCDGIDNNCDGSVDEDTRIVDAGGGGDYTSIQEAIDGGDAKDVICIRPGSYQETVVLEALDLMLVGLEGSGSTVIDGNGQGTTLSHTLGNGSTVVGLTITGGSGTVYDPDHDGVTNSCGGGVFIDASHVTMLDVVVTGNEAEDGAGIYVNNGSLNMEDSFIVENVGTRYGGGIRLRETDEIELIETEIRGNVGRTGAGLGLYKAAATLVDCLIADNAADNNGGGFYVGTDSSIELSTCTVTGNSAGGRGGGVRLYGGFAFLGGCEVTDNTAVEYGGGVACMSSDMSISGSNVTSNDPDNIYCDECEGCFDS